MFQKLEPDMPPSHHYVALLHDNLASLLTLMSASFVWIADDKHIQIMVGLASFFCAVTMGIRNVMAMVRGRP